MRSPRPRRRPRSTLWLYLSLIALSLAWLLLDQWKVLRPIQKLTQDARFRVRGPLPSPLKLIYVDIDTESIQELGNFPWDREIFAQICEVLIREGGVKAIGIDVVFSDAGVPNIADRERVARGHARFGQFLFAGEPPPVVLAASYSGKVVEDAKGELVPLGLPRVAEGARDVESPELPEWSAGVATFYPPFVGLIDTLDGDTRRVPMYVPAWDKNYFHLSLELARMHFGVRPEDVKVFDDHIDLTRPDGELVRRVPLIERQMVDINWFSPWNHESRSFHSATKMHTMALAAESGDPELVALVKNYFADGAFKDAIVLIGPVDPLMQDLAPTPFDRVPAPKVGVHGNMVKTIVAGNFLEHPPRWMVWTITFALTGVVVGLSLAADGRRSAMLRCLAALVLVGYVAFAFAAFGWWGWVLPLTAPVGAALSSAFIGGAAQLVLEQKQKSRIKGLFGAYLAPSVVSQMVDSGEEPKLGGVEEEITAYFSDVQSFSTFSEVLSPTQLVELMNEYLTACTDIVQAEGGTLDKYVGDAVVAIYGAPLVLPGHALRAAVAALRVERRCAELREKWRHEMPSRGWPELVTRLRTRVGLNTGRAVVGNMGSASRFSYTMMGDTVNLAARMESGGKSWGVFTMCAEPTRLACVAADPERVVFRALGRVVVKGRSAPVPIHELVGLREDVSDRTREAITIFEAGLARFYAQDWAGAMERFAESAKLEANQIDPSKGVFNNPSVVYQSLVNELRANPPGADWNGAYVMRAK